MPDSTKITLSLQERQLMADTGWILTKQVVIGKVYALLGQWSEQVKIILEKEKDWLPEAVLNAEPRIYRGENYRQLPYVLLDHPRLFNGGDAFAVRTMFWWGHFFSLTLQLDGAYKKMFEDRLLLRTGLLCGDAFFIGMGDDPWQHHFEPGNYKPVNQMNESELEYEIRNKRFIKLAIKFPLDEWDILPGRLEEGLKILIETLKP